MQSDPRREIKYADFSCEYLGRYGTGSTLPALSDESAVLPLKHYNTDYESEHGYNLFTDRVSLYLQATDGKAAHSTLTEGARSIKKGRQPKHSTSANGEYEKKICEHESMVVEGKGNVIVIFTEATSRSVDSTLLKAHGPTETRWRKLSIGLDHTTSTNPEETVTLWMDTVLKDVFGALLIKWNRLLLTCAAHVGILEDEGKSCTKILISRLIDNDSL